MPKSLGCGLLLLVLLWLPLVATIWLWVDHARMKAAGIDPPEEPGWPWNAVLVAIRGGILGLLGPVAIQRGLAGAAAGSFYWRHAAENVAIGAILGLLLLLLQKNLVRREFTALELATARGMAILFILFLVRTQRLLPALGASVSGGCVACLLYAVELGIARVLGREPTG